MKVLAVALADRHQRYVRGYPPRGPRLFLRPNLEVMRLAGLLEAADELLYLDERVEPVAPPPLPASASATLVVIHVALGQADSAAELAQTWEDSRFRVFFGPQVTAWQEQAPPWCAPRVIGDLADVWPQLRSDALAGCLRPLYRASGRPGYAVPRPIKLNPEMAPGSQFVQFVRGCFCPEPVKSFCSEYLYYGAATLPRRPDEIVGEVLSLPRKRVHLLDDDVSALPDYYGEVFGRLQPYRRQWIVHASDRLFAYPKLIRLLSKAGTRVVFLNESFLLDRVERILREPRQVRQFYRRVKTLQAGKMLVGARLVLPLEPEAPTDYDRVAAVLQQLDLDFIEPRFLGPDGKVASVTYHPMVTPSEPAWLKHRFYAMDAIVNRVVRRPRRVGFFTTATYLLPYSAAYRQSFLEGLPSP